MARKGELGREKVKQQIISAFGADFVGEQDKKLYVWADDGGEKVQFAITLTMPKNPIGEVPKNSNDWTSTSASVAPASGTVVSPAVTEITAEDEATIQELMKNLGIMD